MNTIAHLPQVDQNSDRALVAAEVRGYLAKRNIPAYKISERLQVDKSRGYWQRRVSGELPFDIDDLSMLARLVGVEITDFFNYPKPNAPLTEKAPGRGGPGASLPDLDSNQEPAGFPPAPIRLVPRADRSAEKTSLAPVTPIRSNAS